MGRGGLPTNSLRIEKGGEVLCGEEKKKKGFLSLSEKKKRGKRWDGADERVAKGRGATCHLVFERGKEGFYLPVQERRGGGPNGAGKTQGRGKKSIFSRDRKGEGKGRGRGRTGSPRNLCAGGGPIYSGKGKKKSDFPRGKEGNLCPLKPGDHKKTYLRNAKRALLGQKKETRGRLNSGLNSLIRVGNAVSACGGQRFPSERGRGKSKQWGLLLDEKKKKKML